jgi:hypothetical protein
MSLMRTLRVFKLCGVTFMGMSIAKKENAEDAYIPAMNDGVLRDF